MTRAAFLSFIIYHLSSIPAVAQTYDVQPGPYTIEAALQQARLDHLHSSVQSRFDRLHSSVQSRLHSSVQDGFPVLRLHPGTYRLLQPVILRPEDSGTRIIGGPGVVISGGVQISNWKKQGRVWVADVPLFNGRPLEFRQLWVNGRKAVRARSVPVGLADGSDPFEHMPRILSVDKQREIIYVRSLTPDPSPNERGVYSSASRKSNHSPLLGRGVGGEALEMVLHEMWCVAMLRVKDITVQGDSVALTFHQPESHIHFMHPWPSPMVTPGGEHNSAFYLTGSRELLDEPGEWHLDTRARKLYYIPREGEDMRTAEVVAPALETLFMTQGTPDEPVSDISIEGITFEHTTWMRPSLQGHAPLQAGMYMTEAYKIRPQIRRPNGDHGLDNQGWVGRPAAAVAINCAERVSLSGCTFRHLASTALDYHLFVNGGTVDHCTFTDIGGTAILAGSFGGEGHEAHLPYDPMDRREICTGLTIQNNRIDDATNEDWGTIGIAAGFVRNISILHNEISNVSYTGISLGWGWNQQTCSMANNTVRGNYIHHYARHNYDCAGIYTLGSQPHTFIEENVVDSIYTPSYVHDPNHWFYLYTDEGSSYITVRNNWTPAEKFLKNSNGPGCTWENNGPMVADSIRQNAGITAR
ncbi:MAG: right-handed parallel beta-helix repeat-containing protein [Prevotella sp.]|nr:right-handed parallel beta-helix repeat-containing protein [Prevotella sp.]